MPAPTLFEQITELPEYYPTRTEVGILNAHAADISALIPPNTALIEFGSGSSTKTRIVLSAAETLGAYVPVDISGQFLHQQMVGAARANIRSSRCFRSPPISPSRSTCPTRSG